LKLKVKLLLGPSSSTSFYFCRNNSIWLFNEQCSGNNENHSCPLICEHASSHGQH